MTDEEKIRIRKMRDGGMSCANIAADLGMSVNTVKSFLLRAAKNPVCRRCGAALIIRAHKEKVFCSDKCRTAWWNSHRDQGISRTYHVYVCPNCGKSFVSYADRVYCSRACSAEGRREIARKKKVEETERMRMEHETEPARMKKEHEEERRMNGNKNRK